LGNFSRSSAKRPPKAADLAEHLPVEGLAGEHLDALFAALGAGDIDTGVGVANAFFRRRGTFTGWLCRLGRLLGGSTFF
jgi:hypothetical protein